MKTYAFISLILLARVAISQPIFGVISGSQRTDITAIKTKWSFLKDIIADKKIVAIGENLHGVKEFNAVKLELLQYLHEEMGFNVIAIESDLAMNYFGNKYKELILDTILLKELFSPVWHTEEYLEMVRYLKRHPDLKIIGFDINTKLSVQQISNKIGVAIDSTADRFKQFFANYSDWKELSGENRTASVGERDSTMADILKWIITDLYHGEKVIISAHNNHISKVKTLGACMGELLKNEFGEDYYSIGLFRSLGNPKHVLRDVTYENVASELPKNSIQYNFLQTGKDWLFFDVKNELNKGQNQWLAEELFNVLQTNRFKYKMNLAKSFDGIIWIKKVTYPNYVIRNKYLRKKN